MAGELLVWFCSEMERERKAGDKFGRYEYVV